MSFTAIAHKDFSDARRSRSLWVLSGLFVLFTLLMTYLYTVIPELEGADPAELSAIGLLGFIAAPATLFVTLAAIVICYKAVALALGAWVVLELLWDAVPLGLVFVANGFALPANLAALPSWAAFVSILSPSVAYSHAATGLLTDGATGTAPFYLQGWFAVVILAVWVLLPVTVG